MKPMNHPRLDSSKDKIKEVIEVGEVKITPLVTESNPEEDKRNVKIPNPTNIPVMEIPEDPDIKQYIENQNNRVVAFVINWIKTVYTKDLMGWLMNDFKNELIKELKK